MDQTIKFSDSLKKIISHKLWRAVITFLIILNTIILGMQTYPELTKSYGQPLEYLDQKILYLFIIELIIRFAAHGREFFKDSWSIFDLFIISISLIPSQDAFSALRAARALRTLRLISAFPKLKKVIEGLVFAVPGIAAIAGVMIIIICVFGLIASKLYGALYPEWFGNLHRSVFSLFQIMTLEGWPDIARTVMQEKPFSWLFFVTYILIATFSVLNLFIAVVVDAMQRTQSEDAATSQEKIDELSKKIDIIIKKIDAG